MRPLFQLLNTRVRLPLTQVLDASQVSNSLRLGYSQTQTNARNIHNIQQNEFRQLIKPSNKNRRLSFSLAEFKNRQLYKRRYSGRRPKKKNPTKRRVRKPIFDKRLRKHSIFLRPSKGVKVRKTVSNLKLKKPKNRRQRKQMLARRILLAFHVRRMRRLFSRTLRYRQGLRKCMPRIHRIKRLRLQRSLSVVRSSSYLAVSQFVGLQPHWENAPKMFNAEFQFKNIKFRPKKISPLNRFFRTFKSRRPRYRFKRKKIIRFKRRRVPSYLRKRRKSPIAIRVKFNFFAKRLFRSKIPAKPTYETDSDWESLTFGTSDYVNETLRRANRVSYEIVDSK